MDNVIITEMKDLARLILHFDMDAFFASVEQRDNEAYRGKPLIVGGLSPRGVVSTASYEARKYGVHSAMPMSTAKRLCKNGIFIAGNHKKYRSVSNEIFTLLSRFSPVIEPLSIDEGFLDLTGMESIIGTPIDYGMKIKRAICDATGLVASVGIAPNKFLAKLASDLEKPNGLTVITEGDIERVVWPLPVTRIWGVGKKTGEKLRLFNYRTIGDIAKSDYESLSRELGSPRLARHLMELANGRDERPVEPTHDAQSIGRERTFGEDIKDDIEAERELLSLAEEVGYRLRKEGEWAKTISVKIRLADFSTHTRQKTLPEPTQYDEDIYASARELFHSFSRHGRGIRLLGVSTSGFGDAAEMSLFDTERDGKKKNLYDAIDTLKKRFGESIVTKAPLVKNNNETE